MPRDKQLDKLLLESNTSMKEYKAMYHHIYQQMRDGRNIRYSGKEYTNTPERLQAIKDKYANGVTPEILAEMFNN